MGGEGQYVFGIVRLSRTSVFSFIGVNLAIVASYRLLKEKLLSGYQQVHSVRFQIPPEAPTYVHKQGPPE